MSAVTVRDSMGNRERIRIAMRGGLAALWKPWPRILFMLLSVVSATGWAFGSAVGYRTFLLTLVVASFIFHWGSWEAMPPTRSPAPSIKAQHPTPGDPCGFYLVNPATGLLRWWNGEQFTTRTSFDAELRNRNRT